MDKAIFPPKKSCFTYPDILQRIRKGFQKTVLESSYFKCTLYIQRKKKNKGGGGVMAFETSIIAVSNETLASFQFNYMQSRIELVTPGSLTKWLLKGLILKSL